MRSVCILLTDHESINDLILKKSFNNLKKSKLKKIYFIGDKNKFKNAFNISKKIKKICFINITLNKSCFHYLKKITFEGIKLFNDRKVNFLINMPLDKKKFFSKKFRGYTEFFSEKFDQNKNENMLLYNKNFSVCPLTTHIEINKVEKEITKKKLINSIINLVKFFKTINKKIKIEVLGLNPHAGRDFGKQTVEKKIITPVIKYFKKKKYLISGPVSADTAFAKTSGKVFVGMYHDQVLIPFKTLNKFDGINITIGKKLIRMSPDHGTAKNIKKTNTIDTKSFINCIKFCEI